MNKQLFPPKNENAWGCNGLQNFASTPICHPTQTTNHHQTLI